MSRTLLEERDRLIVQPARNTERALGKGVEVAEAAMSSVSLVCDGSSGDVNLEGIVADTFKEIFNLWKERQRKYGSSNIAAFGEIGCVVRGYDKMARLRHALLEGKGMSADVIDSVEDSWKDLTNYAVMGLVCHRRLWPGT